MTTGPPEHLAARQQSFRKARAPTIVVEQHARPRCGSLEPLRPLLPHPLPDCD